MKNTRIQAARQHLLGVEFPSVRLDTGGSQRNRSDKNQWWNSWRRSIRKNIGLFHLSAEDVRGPPRGAVDRAAETVAGAPREGGVNQRVLPSLASSPVINSRWRCTSAPSARMCAVATRRRSAGSSSRQRHPPLVRMPPLRSAKRHELSPQSSSFMASSARG